MVKTETPTKTKTPRKHQPFMVCEVSGDGSQFMHTADCKDTAAGDKWIGTKGENAKVYAVLRVMSGPDMVGITKVETRTVTPMTYPKPEPTDA